MKTIKQVEIVSVFVDQYLPEYKDMEENKLYISREFGCSHKCFCGCGQHIYINFGKEGWQLTEQDNGKVTISPSLQHFNGCKSHYIITKNKANFV
jgi:hypothetical protein